MSIVNQPNQVNYYSVENIIQEQMKKMPGMMINLPRHDSRGGYIAVAPAAALAQEQSPSSHYYETKLYASTSKE